MKLAQLGRHRAFGRKTGAAFVWHTAFAHCVDAGFAAGVIGTVCLGYG